MQYWRYLIDFFNGVCVISALRVTKQIMTPEVNDLTVNIVVLRLMPVHFSKVSDSDASIPTLQCIYARIIVIDAFKIV